MLGNKADTRENKTEDDRQVIPICNTVEPNQVWNERREREFTYYKEYTLFWSNLIISFFNCFP